jgi:hypothetical protein
MTLRRLVELLVALVTRRPLIATRLTIRVGRILPIHPNPKERAMAELLVLTDEQKVVLFLEPKTAAGNPAKVDGVPEWSVSNADVLALQVSADGMSAVAVASGPLGGAQVNVTADADLGEGARPITAVQDIEVRAAEATQLGIRAGAPEPK